jgi:hypothetical protein
MTRVYAFLLFVWALLATAAAQNGTQPNYSALTDEIITIRSSQLQAWSKPVGGTAYTVSRVLDSYFTIDRSLRVSPNGRYIAYYGYWGTTRSLRLFDLQTNSVVWGKTLFGGREYTGGQMSWSADSTTVYVPLTDYSGFTVVASELWKWDIVTNTITQLTNYGPYGVLHYEGDFEHGVQPRYVVGTQGAPQINELTETNGRRLSSLWDGDGGAILAASHREEYLNPRLSPSGMYLMYTILGSDFQTTSVVVMDTSTGQRVKTYNNYTEGSWVSETTANATMVMRSTNSSSQKVYLKTLF